MGSVFISLIFCTSKNYNQLVNMCCNVLIIHPVMLYCNFLFPKREYSGIKKHHKEINPLQLIVAFPDPLKTSDNL